MCKIHGTFSKELHWPLLAHNLTLEKNISESTVCKTVHDQLKITLQLFLGVLENRYSEMFRLRLDALLKTHPRV